jgi:predicted O-methyltransferase YrrM
MSAPAGEPTTPDAVEGWIAEHTPDRFRHVAEASHAHRERHGRNCDVYPSGSGPLLGVLAAAANARRVLELGSGLGYSTLWLAFGAGPGADVETIDEDAEHIRLARENFEQAGLAERITVHEGRGRDVLPALTGPYDLVFADSDPAEYELDLEHFVRLVRPGGLLVSANLFLGRFDPKLPGLEQAAAYRRRLVTDERFLTAFASGGLAVTTLRN